ncbi:Neprilysin-2-like protein, partial [Dinothrombium tinctorium]
VMSKQWTYASPNRANNTFSTKFMRNALFTIFPFSIFNFAQKYKILYKTILWFTSLARNLYDDMNLNIDPCEDFYEFCCGKFEQKSNLTDDQNYVSKFTIVQEKNKEKLKGMKNEI